MDFLSCVAGRRSVRAFTNEPVEHETLERAVKAASYAPSWKNSQVVRYTVIENAEVKRDIADNCVLDFAHNQRIISDAPALVVQSVVAGRSGFERDGSPTTSKGDGWEMFDAGLSAQTFCLAAYNEGLGTVILGIFDEFKTAAAACLPEGQKVSALIAVGHPAEAPVMPKRKDVEQLLSFV